MMSTINDLNTTNTLEDGDKFVIWKRQAGATRAITAENAATYFDASYQPISPLLTSIASLGPQTVATRFFVVEGENLVGLATPAEMLTEIGAQPVDPALTMYAALGMTDGKIVRGTGVDTAELIDQEDIKVIASGSVTPRTLGDRFSDSANAFDFGALGDNIANDTAALTALLAEDDIFIPEGTYLVDGLVLLTGNKRIRGAGMGRTIIKLRDAANAHVLYAQDISDIQLEDLTIDGNKVNQGVGSSNPWRGLYALGECHRWRVKNVEVKDAVDHGLFASHGGVLADEAFKDSIVDGCIVTGCGSSAHLAGGGPGGTGFVGGSESTRWIKCTARGNYLNGFKTGGTMAFCEAYDTVGGGGFESGFSTPEIKKQAYIVCRASNTYGDGFRHQGQGDELLMLGCTADGNRFSGIMLLNGVKRAQILGGRISNNGNGGSRTATTGVDGISIHRTSGDGPSQVIIDHCQIFDDQGSPTQQCGIHVRNDTADIIIGENNIIQGNVVAPVEVISDAKSTNIRIGDFRGATTNHRNLTPVAVTGTTSTTDLMSFVVDAKEMYNGKALKVFMSGTATGTAGTKVIRFSINGNTHVISSQSSGEQQDWSAIAEIVRVGSVAWTMLRVFEEGGQTDLVLRTDGISLATNLTIKATATLGNASDTVTQTSMLIGSEM